MDRLMLGYFSGVEEVGQYAVGRNIAEVSLFPVFAMVMMLRPALAARFSTGKVSENAQIIRNSLRYSFVSGVFFAAIFATLGPVLVEFVFSDTFESAGRLMYFFVGVVVLRSAGAVILPALIAADRARIYAYLTAGSAGLNFLLNLLLIPRYQSRGAIVATIVSYGVLLFLGIREVLSRYRIPVTLTALSVAARTILAGAIASGVVVWLSNRPSPTWVAVLWAALLLGLYFVLIYVLRVSSFSDIVNLLTNLRKQKG
jgi:O-antigen/teichoic acid export membrane protein